MDENNEVHPVAFHSWTFIFVKLKYNIHDKEFLAAFKIWYYYLKSLAFFINIIIDHKSLEYFSITKVLTYRQVQFNLVI